MQNSLQSVDKCYNLLVLSNERVGHEIGIDSREIGSCSIWMQKEVT